MGFSWRTAGAYWLCLIAAQAAFPFLGLTAQQAHVMDVITTVVFAGLFVAVSPVARHNLKQAFRRDGHQWLGEASECEACVESKAG